MAINIKEVYKDTDDKLIVDAKKYNSKVPRIEVVDGKVKIDLNDPLQKKWFEEFEK
ncbi:hypothetical protein [Sporosarcina sp. ITBMC105]